MKKKTLIVYSLGVLTGVFLASGVYEYRNRKSHDQLLADASRTLGGMVTDYQKGVVVSYDNISNVVGAHVSGESDRQPIEDTIRYYQERAKENMFRSLIVD